MEDCIARVDGWPINLTTLPDAVSRIANAAQAGDGFCCFTLNLDHLVKLRSDEDFRRAYDKARFVTADGVPAYEALDMKVGLAKDIGPAGAAA